MKVTNVKFIDKETGKVVLVFKEAEIEGWPFSYFKCFKQGEGDVDSDFCEENQWLPHKQG